MNYQESFLKNKIIMQSLTKVTPINASVSSDEYEVKNKNEVKQNKRKI